MKTFPAFQPLNSDDRLRKLPSLTMTDTLTKLGTGELARLSHLEGVIERGLTTFVEVGAALMEIRDSRLYVGSHSTFEAYLKERWGMRRAHAYRLIDAAKVVEALSPIGDTLPNEAVARELTPLLGQPDELRATYTEAVERHGPEPTAREVAETRQSRMGVHYSSETAEWYTPQHIVHAVQAALGGIDMDPCANPEKSIPAKHHLTAEDDGLAHQWRGRVYMNPPYGDVIGDWTAKLLEEYAAGRVTAGVALVPARTDTKWFDPLFNFPVCFVSGRLRFGNAETGAPFPSACIYLGSDTERFAAAFETLGNIVGPLR